MSVSLPKVKTITITGPGGVGEDVLTIAKMPIGRYSSLLLEAAEIPKSVKGIAKMLFGEKASPEEVPEDTDEFIDFILEIPALLAQNWSDIISLVSIASGVEKSKLETVDIDEATVILEAVMDVNNFFGVRERYSRTMSRRAMDSKLPKQKMTAPAKKR